MQLNKKLQLNSSLYVHTPLINRKLILNHLIRKYCYYKMLIFDNINFVINLFGAKKYLLFFFSKKNKIVEHILVFLSLGKQ